LLDSQNVPENYFMGQYFNGIRKSVSFSGTLFRMNKGAVMTSKD